MEMIFTLFVYLLGLVLGGNVLQTSETDIDGGVKIAAYPYQASIEVEGHHLCGATIVDDFWVLTAESCLRNLTETTVKIRVGTNRLGYKGALHAVTKAVNYTASIISPSFGPTEPTEDGDLSMYKVATSFKYRAAVNWLNVAEQAPNEGDTGYITGWGKTMKVFGRWDSLRAFVTRMFLRKRKKGSVLNATKVTVMAKYDCENAMEGLVNITSAMSCVTSVGNVANNCIAEVGSPLLINHQLAGVVAYSPPCTGESTKPVAVTNVGPYSPYVITTMLDLITRN